MPARIKTGKGVVLEGPGVGGIRNKAGWGESIFRQNHQIVCWRGYLKLKPDDIYPEKLISEDQRVFPFFPMNHQLMY